MRRSVEAMVVKNAVVVVVATKAELTLPHGERGGGGGLLEEAE